MYAYVSNKSIKTFTSIETLAFYVQSICFNFSNIYNIYK